MPGAVLPFRRLLKRQRTGISIDPNGKEIETQVTPQPTDLLCPKRRHELFDRILSELNLKKDGDGQPRTAYIRASTSAFTSAAFLLRMACSPGGRDIEPRTPAALKQDACTAEVVDKLPPQPPAMSRQPPPVTLSVGFSAGASWLFALGDPANAGQRDRQQVVKQADMPSLLEAICRLANSR